MAQAASEASAHVTKKNSPGMTAGEEEEEEDDDGDGSDKKVQFSNLTMDVSESASTTETAGAGATVDMGLVMNVMSWKVSLLFALTDA